MKFGVNTSLWSAEFGQGQLHLLAAVKEHGFDGVEVPLVRPASFAGTEIRLACEKYGLERTVASSFGPDHSLITYDRGVRKATLQHLHDSIRATADLGAHLLGGPLYAPVGYLPGRTRTGDEWAFAVDAYSELGETLAKNDVTLAIEPMNRFETFFLNTVRDAFELCERVGDSRIGILCDTFHANIEERRTAEALRTAGMHLKHVHASENDRGMPGSGQVDWASVVRTLRETHYDGWLTIEGVVTSGGHSTAAALRGEVSDTADAIAFGGLQFLRRSSNCGDRFGTGELDSA